VFEQDSGSPLRAYNSRDFYSGLSDISLTLRSVISIHGNEFVIDFLFHLNGVLETKATITGIPMGTFHARQESRYGFRLRENFIAPVRQFLFHFKVDLDIHGTRNRFQTIDIQKQNVNIGDWSSNEDGDFQQLKIRTDLKTTEQEGAIKNISGRYFLFHNERIKTKYKDPSGYRLQVAGDTPDQLLSPGTGNVPSVSWARYCIAVTKSEDTEESSSSIYSMWDSKKPVVNFQNSIDDNDNIIDQVSIKYFSSELLPLNLLHLYIPE
jgi:diamine oxidase